MDPLAKLFGSPVRGKLLRLFLSNEEAWLTAEEAAFRSKGTKVAVRKELAHLTNAGILKKKRSKPLSYAADPRFAHYEALKEFLRKATAISDTRIANMMRRAGTIRLVALSGLFTGVVESKIDLLIVGDRIEERAIGNIVRTLEAELGRELNYAAFLTPDFRYRIGVYDRLIRDVFDYPHKLLIDKIGV